MSERTTKTLSSASPSRGLRVATSIQAGTIGTVKWYNAIKGFGFIAPEDGSSDVFVTASAVERAGLSGIAEGQKLAFETVRDPRKGKSSAENLRALLSLPA